MKFYAAIIALLPTLIFFECVGLAACLFGSDHLEAWAAAKYLKYFSHLPKRTT